MFRPPREKDQPRLGLQQYHHTRPLWYRILVTYSIFIVIFYGISKGHYHKYSHEVLSVYTNNSPKTPKSLSARKTNLLHFVFKHVEMFIHYTDIV